MKFSLNKLIAVSAFLTILGAVHAFADSSITLPAIGSLNLTNMVQNAGAIDTYDNHGVNRAGVSVRGLWYPNDPNNPNNPADLAWVAGEGTAMWDTSNGAPSGIGLWAGFRLDTLGSKLLGTTPSVGHLPIPSVEFGPTGMYIQNNSAKQHFVYGAAVAAHW